MATSPATAPVAGAEKYTIYRHTEDNLTAATAIAARSETPATQPSVERRGFAARDWTPEVVSTPCAGCYGEWAGCGGEVCVPECAGGGTQPPCIDCLFAAGCTGRFDACSGK